MTALVLGVVVGVVIGWFVPQPAWFTNLVSSAKEKINK